MTTLVATLTEVAAEWRMTRRIYPIYSVLTRSFDFGIGPCRELESPINRSEPEVLARVNGWLAKVDEKVEVHQLRTILQTTHVATEENLRDLLLRQLTKAVKSQKVRDKVDYLCVQYYTHCAAHDSHHDSVHTFAQVAELLRPILGEHSPLPSSPAFAAELEELVKELQQCTSVADLLERKIIVRGREIKARVGQEYFSASGLTAFTRFNYLVRRGFFRLIQSDLHAIRIGLNELEHRGIKTIDCSAAGLSANEPLTALLQVCDDWKTPFRAPYSAAKNFEQILGILKAVKTWLAQPLSAAIKTASVAQPVSREIPKKAAVPSPQIIVQPIVAMASHAVVNGVSKVSSNSSLPVRNEPKAPVSLGSSASPEETTILASKRLEECLEQIAEKLISSPAKNASMSVITLGVMKLTLASWEVAAFVRGGNDIADALQRAVAARALTQIAVEEKKRDASVDLTLVLSLAHAEAAVLQEKIAEAKDAKDIDGAVSLAATTKRLLATIEEAEKF